MSAAATLLSGWRRLARLRMLLILALLAIAASVLTEGKFARPENMVNVLRQVSLEGLIAFGMTLVIVTGGIDLSVGSMAALSGVFAALVLRQTAGWPPVAAIGAATCCGVGLGAAVGACCGAIITRFAIPAFIVTLSAMLMARGFAFILCDGQPIHDLPESLSWLGRGFVLENWLGPRLPVTVLILLFAWGAFSLLFERTVFGRGVVAVGSNEEAARLAGIPVGRIKVCVYLISGALAGLAGVLHDAKLMAGDPKVADMWELNVIAAVVVGGASLYGGRGSMTGTLIGALIIGMLNNGLNLMQVEHFWQKVVLGAVILAASLADGGLRRLEAR